MRTSRQRSLKGQRHTQWQEKNWFGINFEKHLCVFKCLSSVSILPVTLPLFLSEILASTLNFTTREADQETKLWLPRSFPVIRSLPEFLPLLLNSLAHFHTKGLCNPYCITKHPTQQSLMKRNFKMQFYLNILTSF